MIGKQELEDTLRQINDQVIEEYPDARDWIRAEGIEPDALREQAHQSALITVQSIFEALVQMRSEGEPSEEAIEQIGANLIANWMAGFGMAWVLRSSLSGDSQTVEEPEPVGAAGD